MASPRSQAASDTHRLAQTGLSLVAVRLIQHAFADLDLHNLRGTLPEFTQSIAAIVRHYAPASSVLAIEHYTEQRLLADVSGSFRPQPTDPVPLEQIASNVQWATKPLWGPSPDVEAATSRLEGAVGRLVENAGRDTTVNAVMADRKATGWAREAKPTACAFCAMLATRGAVYKSAKSATTTEFGQSYHDHCHCVAVPVFGVYEKTAQAREWSALWAKSTRGFTGMDAKLAAFRAAYAEAYGH